MRRSVQPELLDALPEGHPDALHNRRDIRLINRIQGNFRWMAKVLSRQVRAGDHGCECGAGAGELGAYLHSRRVLPQGVCIRGIDLWSRPRCWPGAWGWVRGDLGKIEALPFEFVFGTHIFHQFEDDLLRRLGGLLDQRCRVFAACEPSRQRRSLAALPLLAPFGLNRISWHDARTSIRAGFVGLELASCLGLDPDRWRLSARSTIFGAVRLLAVRKPCGS